YGEVESQSAVLVEGHLLLRHFRREKGVMLSFDQRLPFNEGNLLLEDRPIAGNLHVVVDCIGEPNDVVRNKGAHAGTGARQPPVLNVAFRELSAGGIEDLRSGQLRIMRQQRQSILQLVTE